MWVFDGEQWTEEGASEQTLKSERKQQLRYEQFMPELQVLEVVQVPKTNPMPPFPMP